MNKILWDFEIKTDILIPTRRPHFVKINKKKRTNRIVDIAVSVDHITKEKEKSDKYLDRALSGATIPVQSGPGRNGNEGGLRIPQSSDITGTSPSDRLVTYPGLSSRRGGSYPSAEVQSVYSTTLADRKKTIIIIIIVIVPENLKGSRKWH